MSDLFLEWGWTKVIPLWRIWAIGSQNVYLAKSTNQKCGYKELFPMWLTLSNLKAILNPWAFHVKLLTGSHNFFTARNFVKYPLNYMGYLWGFFFSFLLLLSLLTLILLNPFLFVCLFNSVISLFFKCLALDTRGGSKKAYAYHV